MPPPDIPLGILLRASLQEVLPSQYAPQPRVATKSSLSVRELKTEVRCPIPGANGKVKSPCSFTQSHWHPTSELAPWSKESLSEFLIS